MKIENIVDIISERDLPLAEFVRQKLKDHQCTLQFEPANLSGLIRVRLVLDDPSADSLFAHSCGLYGTYTERYRLEFLVAEKQGEAPSCETSELAGGRF